MKTNRTILLILLCGVLFALDVMVVAAASKPVSVYLKPDITIQVQDQVKSFYDANGRAVFPLVYQGTTYLPVRAVAALMNENIEWDEASKTIFIGRTLNDPSKATAESAANYVKNGEIAALLKPSPQMVDALLKQDIIIMYDFHAQSFLDAAGHEVYPINYQGSNYLPIRAVSRLMGKNIYWDAGQKLITISAKVPEPEQKVNKHAEELNGLFAGAVAIFDESTAKIMGLQNIKTEEELRLLAASISLDTQKIDQVIKNMAAVKTADFSEAETAAYKSMLTYADSVSYYVLIADNIVYMASHGQDYSLLAETFLNFAMDAQSKYEATKKLLKDL